jgi:uncharacterized phage protein (TIGR02216 family)
MRTGLGMLALSPAHFWSMTPREFDAAVRARLDLPDHHAAPAPLDLQALLARYPDHPDAA